MSWYWDWIEVYGPCLTWETCSCGRSLVAMWRKSKRPGVVTTCPDCGKRNYTMTVIATTN